MHCCLYDLRDKEVINAKNACRLGNICDVEIDSCTGKVTAIMVGRSRLFPCLGKCDEIKICWEDIEVIGDDTVLVCYEQKKSECPPKKKSIFGTLFR